MRSRSGSPSANWGKWTKFHVKQPIPQVENGQDGMKAMWELRPDLVFVDMQMPVMDGVEFLRQASAAFPDSAFIVISGYDNFDYLQNAIRCGASDYLLKPVVEEDLNKAVLEALRKLHPDTDFDDSAADLPEIGAEEVIDIIKNTIDSRYSQNIRIQDFCDKYFFSREYLSKLFKARYQSGIYEYLLSVRMERAKELLADPEIQIQDIASRVGYADNNYFSKAFRNYYGIAPTEYRRNPV
jgi:two-component system response regulator YesN